MLIEAGLVSEEEIAQALDSPDKASLKLGEYLVARGRVKENQLVDLLCQQLRLARYHPDRYPIDPTLAELVPAETAQAHHLVPLKREQRLLMLAMTDPMDIKALDAVAAATRLEVEPVVCTERELHQLSSGVYGVSVGLNGIFQTAEQDLQVGGSPDDVAQHMEDLRVDSLMGMAEGAPVVRMVNWILSQAVREGASDIHISPEREYVQLRFRIDGKLREVPPPPKRMLLAIISRIKILARMDIAVSRVPQDGRFTVKFGNRGINIRVSCVPTVNGENVVLRLLDPGANVYTLDNLGMCETDRLKIEHIIERPHGMILSTGPTGSGKTTSLYAILRRLNQPDVHIITVEDPVEYRIEKIRQLQLNTRAGMTFANGLRSILRQDPDIIMVGEIRDPETARIATQAALTGHKVLSTVHTNDAAGAVTRLIDMEIEPFLVASVLMASFAQRLVRRSCTFCGKEYEPPRELLRYWGFDGSEDVRFIRGTGCNNCMHSGYKGRVGIYEVLALDETIRNLIVERAPTHELAQAARAGGDFRTLREDAAQKIRDGVTTVEEATSVVIV